MSFQSVHDMLTPPGIVRKTKFWDFFDGDSLRSWWTLTDSTGTGSGAMNDAIDGGYRLTSGTGFFDLIRIDFNNISHYEETGCVFIGILNIDSITSNTQSAGLADTGPASPHRALYKNASGSTFLQLETNGGSTTTGDSSIAIDTVTHKAQINMRSASALLTIDDLLEVVNTANLPTQPMQPTLVMLGQAGSAKTGNYNYCEAYNT